MRRIAFLPILSLALALLALCLVVFFQARTPRIGLIDNARLLQQYQGTLEMNQRNTASQNRDQFHLDSLRLHLESEYKSLQAVEKTASASSYQKQKEAFVALRNRYGLAAEQSQRVNVAREQEQLEQISTQLNAYVLEYGAAKGYDYLLGANGSGNIWYVGEAADITSEVLQYVNDRYEGK